MLLGVWFFLFCILRYLWLGIFGGAVQQVTHFFNCVINSLLIASRSDLKSWVYKDRVTKLRYHITGKIVALLFRAHVPERAFFLISLCATVTNKTCTYAEVAGTQFTCWDWDKMVAILQKIFQTLFMYGNCCILIKISPKFVHRVTINTKPSSVQVVAWHRSGVVSLGIWSTCVT